MGKRKSLFEEEVEVLPEEPVLKVNQDFAKRFEHNEKRAELHRLKEKYPEQAAKLEAQLLGAATAKAAQGVKSLGRARAGQGAVEEESSSDEEEDDGYIPPKTEAQLLEILVKIRSKDQSIYSKDAKFFASESSEDEGEGQAAAAAGEGPGGASKGKPLYLKDVLYRQAMENGAAEGSESDDDNAGAGGRKKREGGAEAEGAGRLAYNEEQQELRKAFLKVGGGSGAVRWQRVVQEAFEEEGEPKAEEEAEAEGEAFGGVLKKRRGREVPEADQPAQGGAGVDARVQSLLDSYFGAGQDLPETDRFLKNYILKQAWVDREDLHDEEEGGGPDFDFEEADREDEQYLEQAEEYEHRYNFRYEEPGGAEIVTYPRKLEGVVRKEDDRRKRKRADKAERLRAEESQRQQELKRLKNLKKQEIEEKLSEIQQVAGRAAPNQELLDRLVAGDFDPEEYDRQMAAAFGDDYYQGADEGEEDLADAQFEQELAAMAGGPAQGEEDAAAGFDALRKKLLGASAGAAEEPSDTEGSSSDEEGGSGASDEEGEGEEDEEEEEEGEGGGARGPAKTAEQLAKERAEVQRLLEEYYKLDYEDYVGGVKTRFRPARVLCSAALCHAAYKEVPQDDFGLSVEELLALTDKELNQVVGLRQLAPYREDGSRRFRPNYGALNAIRAEKAQEAEAGPNKRRKQEWWAHKGGGRGEWTQGGTKRRGGSSGGGGEEDFFEREGSQGSEQVEGQPQQQQQQQQERHKKKEGNQGQQQEQQQQERPKKGNAKAQGQGQQQQQQGKQKAAKQAQGGEEQAAPKSEKQRRLESFAKPSLKRGERSKDGQAGGRQQQHQDGGKQGGGGSSKQRKREQGGQQQQQHGGEGGKGHMAGQQAEQQEGPQLTKAQRKNLRRAQKRAQKRGGADGAAVAAS
ncbi:hypothetical protein N2152v2_007725 [Parachlorella kessleri]